MSKGSELEVLQTDIPAVAQSGPIRGRSVMLFYIILAIQLICAVPFLYDLWGEVLALRTTGLPWYMEEVAQVLASAGLVAGIVGAGIYMAYLRKSQYRIARLDQQIGAVSGNFHTQLQAIFDQWRLSRSEVEIAIYAMKGFSNAEIGELRGTSAATVKSQTNAIYRKSGFSGRQQLISFLVEELLIAVAPEVCVP